MLMLTERERGRGGEREGGGGEGGERERGGGERGREGREGREGGEVQLHFYIIIYRLKMIFR